MDPTKNIPFVSIYESSPLLSKDLQTPNANDISRRATSPFAIGKPNISPLPNNLIHVDYNAKYPYIASLCGREIDLLQVEKALDFINQESGNNAKVGCVSKGTTKEELLAEDFHVINSFPEISVSNDMIRSSGKRPFHALNYEPPERSYIPPSRQAKYQAGARSSGALNVETPYKNNSIGIKEKTGGSTVQIDSGIKGMGRPDNGGGIAYGYAIPTPKETKNNPDHEKLSDEEKIQLLLGLVKDACNKEPHVSDVVPAGNNPSLVLPVEDNWNTEPRSPLITLAPIEESEDYVDPLLWVKDDDPLEFSKDFKFPFPEDVDEDVYEDADDI